MIAGDGLLDRFLVFSTCPATNSSAVVRENFSLMNNSVKKKVNFINSSQNEGLSPSCIALSFDGFDSISWTVFGFFGSFTVFTIFRISTFSA
jgi:hypothetical protein